MGDNVFVLILYFETGPSNILNEIYEETGDAKRRDWPAILEDKERFVFLQIPAPHHVGGRYVMQQGCLADASLADDGHAAACLTAQLVKDAIDFLSAPDELLRSDRPAVDKGVGWFRHDLLP